MMQRPAMRSNLQNCDGVRSSAAPLRSHVAGWSGCFLNGDIPDRREKGT